MYERDVTAEIQGPSQLRVGEEVYLTVRLHYSDGTVFPTAPSGTSPGQRDDGLGLIRPCPGDGRARDWTRQGHSGWRRGHHRNAKLDHDGLG